MRLRNETQPATPASQDCERIEGRVAVLHVHNSATTHNCQELSFFVFEKLFLHLSQVRLLHKV